MAVSREQYNKVVSKLRAALAKPKDEFMRDAVTQRFEFCVDLAWKLSRKLMGTSSTAPKEVVREMAQNGLIDDVHFWLESIDMRNLSSHTYNEDLAEKVYGFAARFLIELEKLETKLQSK